MQTHARLSMYARNVARWLMLAAVLAVVMMTANDALACPMCKAALGSHGRDHGDLVGGFFWSILFMLSMPFLIFGSLSTYMYLLVRRARREAAQRNPNLDKLARENAANSSATEQPTAMSAR
ncbi:MAG TPA: hypothetical protein VNH11_05960 [Pirellulales bacterium]|nr:hypothetical protein [Pirellulales bacterium]